MVGMSRSYTGKNYTLPEDFQYTNLERLPASFPASDRDAIASAIASYQGSPGNLLPSNAQGSPWASSAGSGAARLPAQQPGWGNYQGQMPNYTGRTYNTPHLKDQPDTKENLTNMGQDVGVASAKGAAKGGAQYGAGSAASGGAEGTLVGALGTGAAAGAVGAYYGPSYMRYAKELSSGKADADTGVKSAMLSNPITAWGVPIMDAMGVNIGGSGKGKDQMRRDLMRNGALRDLGILGPDKNKWDVTLADGTLFDVGRDGNNPAKLYNIDMSDPVNAETATQARLFSQILSGGDQKTATQWGAILGNAAVSNAGGDQAKATANLKAAVADKFIGSGMNAEHASQILAEQLTKGSITQEEHDALASKIPMFFGGKSTSTATSTQGSSKGKTTPKAKKKVRAAPKAEKRYEYKTPPVLPGPGTLMPQPARISPEDYARAIADVYRQNQGR